MLMIKDMFNLNSDNLYTNKNITSKNITVDREVVYLFLYVYW